MSVIKQLDEKVCNMIAAGEVVLGPESVVKELVENAIDAGATSISIDLEEAGLAKIEIIDNGCGMDKADAQLAFSRHATSKISSAFDLASIKTLGFRGEALPSIASVSNLTLFTKRREDSVGVKVETKNGNIINVESANLNDGTRIIVTKLFYNVPARLKYLKGENVILPKIVNIINKYALAKPNIAFKLVNNETSLLVTSGLGDYSQIFLQIYGKDVAKLMYHINDEKDGMKLDVHFSSPAINRARKNEMTLIVNGRYVVSNMISNVIVESYETYIPKYRYPVCLINLDIDPLLIDINVHPQKMEIKFSLEDEVKEFISATIKKGLRSILVIPEVEEKMEEKIDQLSFSKYITPTSNKVEENTDYQKIIAEKIAQSGTDLFNDNDYKKEEKLLVTEVRLEPRRLPYLEYIGQLAGTYLLFQNEEGLYLLDQHALQERINYEYYYEVLANPNTDNIDLLVPYVIHLSNEEYLILKANYDKLNDIGFKLEDMGNNTFFIRSTPLWIKENFEQVIEKTILFLLKKNTFDIGLIRDSLAKMIACKASIKANQFVDKDGAYALVNELEKCKNPFSCPHGRPIFVKLALKEIEHLFLRSL